MFQNEAERQRAREAMVTTCEAMYGPDREGYYGEWFDRLYPPVVEAPAPDISDEEKVLALNAAGWFKHSSAFPAATPSPAFAAAVDELEDAVRDHLFNAESTARRYAARAALVRVHLEEVERGKA